MKSPLAQDTTKSAKVLAQQIAKQITEEPVEILKNVKEQTIESETARQQDSQTAGHPEESKTQTDQKSELDKLKSVRRIEALNREISDIQKQDLFKDLQKRISGGEEVPLEDYPELSMEQKQVLKAQMEAVKNQRIANSEQPLIEPQTHKGRQLFNFGKKTEVKRQQTHVEKIVPPSG